MTEFRENITEVLGNNILQYNTKELLLFNILKHISPVSRKVKDNAKSIEKCCNEVLSHFKLNRKATIRNLTTGKNVTPKEFSPTDKFLREVMGLDKVPAQTYSFTNYRK